MRRLALFVAAATAIACGGSSTAPTAITTPAATVTTETFMGTLNPVEQKVHAFTVTTAGNNINVTLLLAGPPATIQLGMALGNPSSTGACALIPGLIVQTPAGSVAQIAAPGAPSGAYCVGIFDVGNLQLPVTYTVTVAHT